MFSAVGQPEQFEGLLRPCSTRAQHRIDGYALLAQESAGFASLLLALGGQPTLAVAAARPGVLGLRVPHDE